MHGSACQHRTKVHAQPRTGREFAALAWTVARGSGNTTPSTNQGSAEIRAAVSRDATLARDSLTGGSRLKLPARRIPGPVSTWPCTPCSMPRASPLCTHTLISLSANEQVREQSRSARHKAWEVSSRNARPVSNCACLCTAYSVPNIWRTCKAQLPRPPTKPWRAWAAAGGSRTGGHVSTMSSRLLPRHRRQRHLERGGTSCKFGSLTTRWEESAAHHATPCHRRLAAPSTRQLSSQRR